MNQKPTPLNNNYRTLTRNMVLLVMVISFTPMVLVTGMCAGVGWIYCPMVTISQPTSRRSAKASPSSSFVSPSPTISPLFVVIPALYSPAKRNVSRDRR